MKDELRCFTKANGVLSATTGGTTTRRVSPAGCWGTLERMGAGAVPGLAEHGISLPRSGWIIVNALVGRITCSAAEQTLVE